MFRKMRWAVALGAALLVGAGVQAADPKSTRLNQPNTQPVAEIKLPQAEMTTTRSGGGSDSTITGGSGYSWTPKKVKIPTECDKNPGAAGCPGYCTANPSAVGCPGYCDANPGAVGCGGDYCTSNPTDPLCNPDTGGGNYCDKNPTAPECTTPPDPDYCTANPTAPECATEGHCGMPADWGPNANPDCTPVDGGWRCYSAINGTQYYVCP